MLLCKKDMRYKCTVPLISKTNNGTMFVSFTTLEVLTQAQAAFLFSDGDFYIYDDFLNDILFDFSNKELMRLNITYNKNSTCKISIKIKGVVDDES